MTPRGAARLAARRRLQDGQAAVELALALPVVALLLVLVVQVGLVVRAQLLVVHAAREGARAAAVSPTQAAARAAAVRAGPLEPQRTTVRLSEAGDAPVLATVSVSYRAATDVALVGRFLPSVTLHASVTMAEEPGG